jgi:hypothetical protein
MFCQATSAATWLNVRCKSSPLMNSRTRRSPLIFRVVRGAGRIVAWLLALGCAVWAFGALYFDFPVMNHAAAWTFLAASLFVRGAWRKLGATFLSCALVLAWVAHIKTQQ